MDAVTVGRTLHAPGTPVADVNFPNSGVFSVTNEMRDGAVVEVATVGREGMLGIGVFLGDRSGAGRTFLQVPDGRLPSMTAGRFAKETARGPFREIVALYAQAHLLQLMDRERYGHVRVLQRRGLQDASCECHEVIRAHFRRLGL